MSSRQAISVSASQTLTKIALVSGLTLLCGVVFSSPIEKLSTKLWAKFFGGNSAAVSGELLERIWSNMLIGSFFLVTLALGGVLYIAISYVVGAGWNTAFRRVPEAMAGLLPITGMTLFVVLAIHMQQYGWHHHGAGDAGTFWFKELWLTPGFWLIRAAIILLLWTLFAKRIVSNSRQQDATGHKNLTTSNVRLSALFLVVFGLSFSVASWDWIMALDPMWFSTVWATYHFSGLFQATLAVIILFSLLLRRNEGPLENIFNDEHLHDLGKLMIGFSCFWMYIWFCQYMLIWYANIPEETAYFIPRTQTSWGPVMILNITLNWGIPFLVLLPRSAKRSRGIMMKVACVVLVGRWVDLYIMVFPSTMGNTPLFGIWEVASICFFASLFGLCFTRAFATANPAPQQDPYLPESCHYHC
ncbi:Putative uncharacterized protein TTHA1760 [hydrothermal vent metagenome]|uniref:Quinol:cytochrome c oxidoreductase quinone-binding subunit 2 n=1 Tax=hydrothermal vent metagenome TaxID=652676 RepID=A0A3B1DJW0_9ZZZZ